MRWKQAVAAILGLAFVPGLVSAQFYQQDFTYAPGFVTVTLTNMDTGDTITPFENHPVNGLWDYVGRPQLQARTGGASATQQVGAINSSYTVNGTDNAVVYEVDPLPAVGGNGAYTPQLGVFDAALVALSEEGINDVQSAIAWDQQYDGPANQARHDFVFSISGAGDPMNDFADGIGWAYLNSDVYGTSGVVGPGTSEEPTFEESLGVGFDIYDNGNEGGNSVSLHFDGRAIASRTIDPDTTNPNTGQPWDFNSFETDELIQATILVSPNDRGAPLSGSDFTVWNRGGEYPTIEPENAGAADDGYLRVVREVAGNSNLIAFDYDGSGASDQYDISFNFRGLNEDATRADGMSFALVPVETYGETGATSIDFTPHEEPNLAGAFGVGFDTFNSDDPAGAPQDDPEGMPNVGNHVSVHFDTVKEAQTNLDLAEINLVTDDPSVWHTASINIDGDNVSITVIDGQDGSIHDIFNDTIPGLSDMGAVRPIFAARTGGEFDHYEIDNFLMTGGDMGLRGDFNDDGVLDATDINSLTMASAAMGNDLTFDLTGDDLVNSADVAEWITAPNIYNSYVGDANLDGEFNSSDLVTVLTAGKYETGESAVWTEGDFNRDGLFNTGDFVAALQGGGYEVGPRQSVAAVPEPAGASLLLLAATLAVPLVTRFRRQRR